MWLEKLDLVDFRNFGKESIEFGRKTNIFVGDNAQGKTNIVEAIYLLATSKSFRANKEVELIRWGAESAQVSGKAGANQVKLIINPTKKKVLVNSRERGSLHLLGLIPIVLFSPESLAVVSGPPEKRRRFLDQTLSLVDKNYLYGLGRYLQTVKRRNRLLFFQREGRKMDLTPWDKQLSDLGSAVWISRINFVESANQLLKNISLHLAGSRIRLDYRPFPAKTEKKKIMERFTSELERRRVSDTEKGATSFGPHRDDFKIILEIMEKNKILEKDMGIFGSRGEQRLATLALKLTELAFLEKENGERPILLLDDILSEFDRVNREQILKTLSHGQSIVTATSADLFPKDTLSRAKLFRVERGKVGV